MLYDLVNENSDRGMGNFGTAVISGHVYMNGMTDIFNSEFLDE